MAFNIGVNVLEVDGRAAPTIVAAPISTAGFLVRSQRGIPNLPILVQGFSDFVANFGGYIDDAFGANAVRGFFDNGGTVAYVTRIARTNDLTAANNATPARVTLMDRNGAATLDVAAGRLGREDPGEWGNALAVAVENHPRGTSAIPAQIVGGQAEPFALADGNTLIVTVNGGSSTVTVTFRAGDFVNIAAASAAEVAAAINRQTTAFKAGTGPTRRLVLSSSAPGPASRLVVAGTAATALGFSGPTANSDNGLAAGTDLVALQSVGGFLPGSAVQLESRGNVIASGNMLLAIAEGAQIVVTADGGTPQPITFRGSDFVSGVGALTAFEVVAAINRQANGFTAALTHNTRLMLLSNRFGTGSTISVAAPAGTIPDGRAALGFAGTETPVAGNGQFGTVRQIGESFKFITLAAGLAFATPANAARVQSVEFDLVVTRNNIQVERFESLSMQDTLGYYVQAVVNDPDRGSGYIRVSDRNNASGVGLDAPAEQRDNTNRIVFSPLTAGSNGIAPDDLNYIGDPAQRTGLYAFDTVRIQLLACPETTSVAVATAALACCERRGDAMFVGTAPRGLDLDGVKVYAGALRGRKVYGALYYPWIQIVNPNDTTGNNPRLWIPPVGHVLGMYARIGDARGVWKAPAGDEAMLQNALGVDLEMTDADHTDLVKNGSVNGIRAIPGSGIIVDSSRTLSTDTRWLFVNVRRLFNFVKVSLRDGLRFVAQEPHSEDLRRMVKFSVVTPFLLGLWRQGAFGSDPAEQVFTVVCGPENNPPAEVNLGNFKIEVYFYPVKPAETIVIIVGQQESGASATDR